MSDLTWWGFGWDTPLRDIGWTYVAIAAGLAFVIYVVRKI